MNNYPKLTLLRKTKEVSRNKSTSPNKFSEIASKEKENVEPTTRVESTPTITQDDDTIMSDYTTNTLETNQRQIIKMNVIPKTRKKVNMTT